MINSIKSILDELDYKLNDEDRHLAEIFNENGYCIIPKSDLISDNIEKFRGIIDSLLKKESWRGGWEGKEEYIKYKKQFQIGANRLGNLFDKHEIFLKLLTEENILKISYCILGDDIKIGALDMREPLKEKGFQDFHMDWPPKKTENGKTENIIAAIYLNDSKKDTGAFRVVPKTHRKTGWVQEHLDDPSSHPDEIIVEVKESTIILFDANLWHSGTTNNSGNRRRVLYLDLRRRGIPQLLNQRIYLNEETQESLSDIEKFLLGVRDNDTSFEDKVFTAGNVYRKQFKTDKFNKNY